MSQSARPRRGGATGCVVTEVTRPTPRMARIQLRGPDLVGQEPAGPDQRVKLLFPEARTFGADPDETSRSRRRKRTYTLLDLDPETGTAAVEFVLHGGGLAGEWAAAAQPGDELALTAPVGRFELVVDATEYLFACDESGLPALTAILADLPAGLRARAYVEVHDDAERRELPTDADVDLTWLTRSAGKAETPWSAGPPGIPPLAALAAELTCEATAAVWVAGEADVVRRLRTRLVAESGLERHRVTAVAYWTRGRAEGDAARGRPER